MLYFEKSWFILIYHKWYFTCRSNFLKTKNKFEVKCTNNKCNKKFTIIMLQIWKVICVYQINGIFRLFGKTKTKKNDFNEFYCATCHALRCATLCSIVNFVLQFWLRAREIKFHFVIYCKYIVKCIFWSFVRFQTVAFNCIYSLACLIKNQGNVDKDKTYMNMERRFFWKKGEVI